MLGNQVTLKRGHESEKCVRTQATSVRRCMALFVRFGSSTFGRFQVGLHVRLLFARPVESENKMESKKRLLNAPAEPETKRLVTSLLGPKTPALVDRDDSGYVRPGRPRSDFHNKCSCVYKGDLVLKPVYVVIGSSLTVIQSKRFSSPDFQICEPRDVWVEARRALTALAPCVPWLTLTPPLPPPPPPPSNQASSTSPTARSTPDIVREPISEDLWRTPAQFPRSQFGRCRTPALAAI
jgi:hypothetical protein